MNEIQKLVNELFRLSGVVVPLKRHGFPYTLEDLGTDLQCLIALKSNHPLGSYERQAC